MKFLAASLVYLTLVFVLGLTKMHGAEKIFLAVVALWLIRRMTRCDIRLS